MNGNGTGIGCLSIYYLHTAAPHANMGFFPFEIVYGRAVRGPLDVLRDTWETVEGKTQTVIEWVERN